MRQFGEEDYKVVFKSSLEGESFQEKVKIILIEGALLEELVAVLEHLVNRGDNPEIVIRQESGRFFVVIAHQNFFTQVRGLASLPRVTAVAMFMSSEAQSKLKEVLKELDCLAGPGEREVWQKAFSL